MEKFLSSKRLKFLFYAGGIFTFYFLFGILQEKITRGTYGESNEKFTCMLALVFVQCVINYIYAKIMLLTFLKQGEDSTRSVYYASAAMTYLLAMVCSNMALQWINYPTQVIGKSAKPIPVMLLGVLLGRKSYALKKYFFVLLVVIGVALFIYKDGKASKEESTNFGFGEFLLILSLLMDGLTGAVQERMKSESQTKSGHMMVAMNKWSCLFLGISILITGEIFEFINFVNKYPSIIYQLFLFSVLSALGQFFIFLTVTEYGPLPCSIVTTTRKFFTVLGSIIFFGNVMTSRQWIATFIVFTGLFLDSFYSSKESAKRRQ
ncbi:hypothetical protein M8J76_017250 [Diaphorina citri]|nr:hypothetical protein M8J75_012119 [Diaphorina citri]KAI5737833.1 hypothetical protein M8J76_017250 [Diaphorina citri]KAI5742454.1 hypothetical protein M8J77_007387 [Diaphorina citri]